MRVQSVCLSGIQILGDAQIADTCALQHTTNVQGSLTIEVKQERASNVLEITCPSAQNSPDTDLRYCAYLTFLSGSLLIQNNPVLTTLDGLQSLVNMNGRNVGTSLGKSGRKCANRNGRIRKDRRQCQAYHSDGPQQFPRFSERTLWLHRECHDSLVFERAPARYDMRSL